MAQRSQGAQHEANGSVAARSPPHASTTPYPPARLPGVSPPGLSWRGSHPPKYTPSRAGAHPRAARPSRGRSSTHRPPRCRPSAVSDRLPATSTHPSAPSIVQPRPRPHHRSSTSLPPHASLIVTSIPHFSFLRSPLDSPSSRSLLPYTFVLPCPLKPPLCPNNH